MSVFDKSGSTFYDSTGQSTSDSQILDVAVEHPQGPVSPPPYDMHGGGGAESFEPLSAEVSDPSFQPGQVVKTGFQFQPWMLLAVGAAIVLLMRNEK